MFSICGFWFNQQMLSAEMATEALCKHYVSNASSKAVFCVNVFIFISIDSANLDANEKIIRDP